jgi:hypothetical protein
MREHAAVAVLKPREEVMGRGGPARLVLREGGGGPMHMARRKMGPSGRQQLGRGRGGDRSDTCCAKHGNSWARGPRLLWARPNRNSVVS